MITSRPHNAAAIRADRGAGPRRTCVGCRQVDEQRALVRLTAEGSRLLVDGRQRRSGRGAYVHRRATCLDTAEKGGLSRSFRRSIPRGSITLIRQHILSVQSEGSDD